jgi:hypothetical protein
VTAFDELSGLHVPNLAPVQDPNMPSKREQFRLIALQTVTQLALSDPSILKRSEKEPGATIVGHAQAIEKYLNNG